MVNSECFTKPVYSFDLNSSFKYRFPQSSSKIRNKKSIIWNVLILISVLKVGEIKTMMTAKVHAFAKTLRV